MDLRLAALRRFAIAITVLNFIGHMWLGFEVAFGHILVALGTAYGSEIALELVDAWGMRRKSAFSRSTMEIIDFLLPAHISAMAISMLLYPGERFTPTALATALAVCSKVLFRAPIGPDRRHFLNPSNTGIAIVLLLFPSVSIAPPYQFIEKISHIWDWIIPVVIICLGTFLNGKFTRRLPLIGGWVGAFLLQGFVRSAVQSTPLIAAIAPATGPAFLLFTFYMITDPATTPSKARHQVAFGVGVAVVYALLQVFHIVFGFFFALFVVCILRGIGLYGMASHAARQAPGSSSQA